MRHEGCQCPCIPKCCPQGYILQKNDNNDGGLHHGYDCQKLPNDAPSLPIVQIKDDPTEPVNQTFFAGVFPSCEGLGSNWTYTHHLDFELEPIYEDYILHLGENETVTTQFDNHLEQSYTKNDLKNDSTLVKHLMFFCFDQLELEGGKEEKTVALTCPKKKLPKLPLRKCCPQGKVLQGKKNTCVDAPNGSSSLSIPINGHMYKGDELEIDVNKVNL